MAEARKTLVFGGAHSRAVAILPGFDDLLVTFDHYNPGKAGWERAKRSNLCIRRKVTLLRLQTIRNDWFVNPDLPALEAALAGFVKGYRRVHGLGYSLGGYAGLRLSRALRLSQMIAVSPQVSLDRGRAPWESRYPEAQGFDGQAGDLAQAARSDLTGALLYDPAISEDRQHARAISVLFPRLELTALTFAGHPASDVLSVGRGAADLRALALDEGAGRREVLALFRDTRHRSPSYWANMAAGLSRRHPFWAARAEVKGLQLRAEIARAAEQLAAKADPAP
ncbi:alpha/beta hydrolase [Anianabacter salinae]|uniref:alpha/beta hydrolase n=1 Tax=Anianabacter salinae TaxID=2851023 RepID=UPI00225E400A|nr:alpha/beta hydrolase [Anianabacter salinae]MBV0911320.1 alpha/beta hydrolase [Anianabacter salinae]